jgi:hypothetical protein
MIKPLSPPSPFSASCGVERLPLALIVITDNRNQTIHQALRTRRSAADQLVGPACHDHHCHNSRHHSLPGFPEVLLLWHRSRFG